MVKLSGYASLISLRDKWQHMRRRRSSFAELAAWPPSELQRIAQDVGASVSDLRANAAVRSGLTLLPRRRSMAWPMYRRVERRALRMHEMMQRLDVDPGKLARLQGGDAYAEARAKCLSCRISERCLRWLDDPAQAGRRPELCPNLPLFEACRRNRVAS